MNNLRQTVRKLNNPCSECKGQIYLNKKIYTKENGGSYRTEAYTCKTCNGKGYEEKLEEGCIVKDKNGYEFPYPDIGDGRNDHKYENLGKPLSLNELLMALGKSCKQFSNLIYNKEDGYGFAFDGLFIPIDIELTPEQYTEELQEKLIEILK